MLKTEFKKKKKNLASYTKIVKRHDLFRIYILKFLENQDLYI